jgi:hypothetical protein
MKDSNERPVELQFHSVMPYALIGPSINLAKINEEQKRIYVTGVDAEE